MAVHRSPLDDLKVAAPCASDWAGMLGDGRVRFCARCNLNVYNLSGMTRAEAEALVTNTEGRLCVRFYRRADATVLTQNCPVGLRAVRRRVSRVAGVALSAALGFLAGLGVNLGFEVKDVPQESAEWAVMGAVGTFERSWFARRARAEPDGTSYVGDDSAPGTVAPVVNCPFPSEPAAQTRRAEKVEGRTEGRK